MSNTQTMQPPCLSIIPMNRLLSVLLFLLVAASVTAQQAVKAVRILTARETAVVGVDRAPDCYHQFREGGVIVTKAGRIVVVAQGREQSRWSDRSGQDLVCRWSDDEGKSWSKTILVASTGPYSICPNATVYDRSTDTVHVLYNEFQWDYRQPESRKAMKGRECRQFQVQSGNGGETWSKPRELTAMLKSKGITTVFGSGEGIQLRHGMHKGRLLVPGGYQKPWGNRVFYSDDHGQTWLIGDRAPREKVKDKNVRLECKVAELADGRIVMNARCAPYRARAFSDDGGQTWTPQEIDKGLPAISCNGALLATRDAKQREVLLLSVPTGPKRSHGTIYASFDGGQTWPCHKTLVSGFFAYSSLIELADGRIGLVYESESHKHLDFVCFDVEDITDSAGNTLDTSVERDGGVLSLHPVFTDHMVLQRNNPVSIFGRAPPGTSIRVSFAGHEDSTRAGSESEWVITLPALPANAMGQTLKVRSVLGKQHNQIDLIDVVCGDVWICAGQSNMRWRVKQSAEAKEVIANADIPELRLIDFEGTLYPGSKKYSREFLGKLKAENYYRITGWQRSSSESTSSFSAVAHAFGKRLVADLKVPIGLIHNAIGGVPMESYLPPVKDIDAEDVRAVMHEWWQNPSYPKWCQQRAKANLAAWLSKPEGARPHHPFEPSFLYAAGIEPLANLHPRGVIWYQGESNATTSSAGKARSKSLNRHCFEALIHGFRRLWDDPDLPFYFVQLPGLNRDWPLFREMQFEVAREVANTGMAITIDLGHPTNVHPKRKVPVGDRLARLALAKTYKRSVTPTGPLFKGHTIQGKLVRIDFEYARGLRTNDGKPPMGFEVAGTDRVFHPGVAEIAKDHISVQSNQVPVPVAVRYAFQNDPATNLVNDDDLPASPFRTDRWKLTTTSTGSTIKSPSPGTCSFEDADKGSVRSLKTALGRFVAKAGHAEITARYARSGSQCLHLLGGDDRNIVFSPNSRRGGELSFWAERWTRRKPFSFRVDSWSKGSWKQIFDGDRVVRVGRGFLTHVRVPVGKGIAKIRLRSTAPEGTGVLIDDLRFANAGPMRLVGSQMAPWLAPALHGHRDNAIAKIEVTTTDYQDPLVVRQCRVSIPESTRLSDIAKVRMYFTQGAGFSTETRFGEELDPARELVFEGEQALQAGVNQFWIAFELTSAASLDRRVSAGCSEFVFADKTSSQPKGKGYGQRIGTAVRMAGQDACHTYRIPGLVTTNKGTLIAVYDCRYNGSGDLPGDVDVGMSRSLDGGSSWEPMRVIMDMGRDKNFRFDGIGDPSILVDRESGAIWVAATWSHGNRSWRGSGPGLKPEETGQLMLSRSDDDGLTWSRPINITGQVKDPKWRFVLQGPGKGITMRNGTLVFPAQYRSADDSPHQGKPFSTMISSVDHGKTWRIGTGVKVDTTEAQIVELADGSLMINCRDNRGGSRSVYTTKDLGRTWQMHSTNRGALPEPVCMASLIRIDHKEHGPLLVFSNPATRSGRFNMTLKVSSDEGATWPAAHHSLYDQRKGAGYSCLTRIDQDHVGVLYEGHRELYFLRFPIKEIFAGR